MINRSLGSVAEVLVARCRHDAPGEQTFGRVREERYGWISTVSDFVRVRKASVGSGW